MKTTKLSTIAILSLALFACQDFNGLDSTTSETDELVLKSAVIAETDLMVESVSDEVVYEAEFFAESEKLLKQLARFKGGKNLLSGHKGNRYLNGYAPDVSIDTAATGYPVTITINYGVGSELKNGRKISGLVTIEISAPRGTDGATRLITYTNCVIDSVNINGTAIETFNGDNETARTINNNSEVTFILPDGTVIERTGTHTRNWIEGLSTPLEHDDDVIEITGSLTATTSTGNTWERGIIEPLLRTGDCRHHVQGVIEFSQNGEVISTLDFGDGTCDNLALLTVEGETVEIELKGRAPKANVDKYRSKGKK